MVTKKRSPRDGKSAQRNKACGLQLSDKQSFRTAFLRYSQIPVARAAGSLRLPCIDDRQVSWLADHRVHAAFPAFRPVTRISFRSPLTVTGSYRILTCFPFTLLPQQEAPIVLFICLFLSQRSSSPPEKFIFQVLSLPLLPSQRVFLLSGRTSRDPWQRCRRIQTLPRT